MLCGRPYWGLFFWEDMNCFKTIIELQEILFPQFYTVKDSENNEYIFLKTGDSVINSLHNDDRAIIEAKPGDYRERQSGKVIKNPDYISQWTVTGNGSKENIDNYKKKDLS